jgi:hypothetical protein
MQPYRKDQIFLKIGLTFSEVFWKLKRAIELLSYGCLRPCLCTPCEWPDDGSFSYNTPVFHTNCVLYRKQQHTNNITEQSRDSGNHQSPPPSPSPSHIQNQSHMENEVRLGTRFKHPSTTAAPPTVSKDGSIGKRKGFFNKGTSNPPSPSKPSPAKASSLSKATPPGNHSRASNTPVSSNTSPISRLTPRNVHAQPAVLTQQINDVSPSTSRPRKPPVPPRFITRKITRPASRTPTRSTIIAQTPKNIGAR